MQVTLETLPGLERKIKVKIPSDRIENEVKVRLQKLAPKVKLDGFRPGKVPFPVLKQRFEQPVRSEVISDLLRSTYSEAIEQEKIQPVAPPTLNVTHADVADGVEYEATIEVFPTFELKGLENTEIEGMMLETTEKNIDEMLEKLRKQNAEWREVDRPAQMGDRVEIDFESTMEGQPFEGSTGKNVTLELGSNSAIPGFEAGIVGTAANNKAEIDLVFPDDYPKTELANKAAHSSISVHRVLEPVVPELNEDFAKKMDVGEGTIASLRAEIRKTLDQEHENTKKNHLRNQVIDKIVAANPLELPNALINAEAERLLEQAKQYYHRTGETGDETKERFIPLAKQRVHLGILFNEFVRVHQLTVDPAKVQKALEEIAASYKDPQQVVNWYRNNKEQMAQVEASVMEEQIIDALIKQAKVVEKLPGAPITR